MPCHRVDHNHTTEGGGLLSELVLCLPAEGRRKNPFCFPQPSGQGEKVNSYETESAVVMGTVRSHVLSLENTHVI